MKIKFTSTESIPLIVTSPDILAKAIDEKIYIALPERLFCKDDKKLVQVLMLIMPHLFENYLTGIKGDHLKPWKKIIEIDNQNINVLVYHTKDNNKIFILPTKDLEKGIYLLEIWQVK